MTIYDPSNSTHKQYMSQFAVVYKYTEVEIVDTFRSMGVTVTCEQIVDWYATPH